MSQFQTNLAQSILEWRGIHVCLNEGLCPFPRGEKKIKNLILQIHWVNLNKLWFQATLGFEEAHIFPRGENTEIAKVFLSIINGPFLTVTAPFAPTYGSHRHVKPRICFTRACFALSLECYAFVYHMTCYWNTFQVTLIVLLCPTQWAAGGIKFLTHPSVSQRSVSLLSFFFCQRNSSDTAQQM